MTWSAEAQRQWTRPKQPIGSTVALVIFTLITAAHLRIRAETGASLPMLLLAIVAAGAADEPDEHHAPDRGSRPRSWPSTRPFS